ncbi:hypothetical protein [Tepidiforma sp.]|uniref:hypothetical protein n=1 Tax=Tepidiforma sp. TaxID=2682230 RepID=UPI002ADDFD75|nr:hypothetical protein [Tepidiforma sp.]
MACFRSIGGAVAVVALFVGAVGAADRAGAQSPPEPPSRFVGTVTVDGQPAPAGTPVEARIGGVSCGVTTVFLQGGQARYVIDVAGAASQPGCGAVGTTITFIVGGSAAPQTGVWRNYELTQLDLALVRATPTPASSPAASPTPRPPVAGTGLAEQAGPSTWWVISMAALGALGFIGMGWAASRPG